MPTPAKPAAFRRDYAPLLREAMSGVSIAAHELSAGGNPAAMRFCVELLWRAFRGMGVSWVGFYVKERAKDEMTLVCREPKPACSPIGLHGMCGRCWQERRPIVVADIATLGAAYIACDPKDRSELVVPMIAPDGSCPGVLDLDSFELNAFDETDAKQVTELLVTLGLSVPGLENLKPLRL